MSERTLVPIFFFWAFLTIITPTLILLSETSKAPFDSNGNSAKVLNAQKNGWLHSKSYQKMPPPPPAMTVVNAKDLASASAATPSTSPGTNRIVTHTGSFHNYTLRSNRTHHHGLTLLSSKTHVEVKQTSIRYTST